MTTELPSLFDDAPSISPPRIDVSVVIVNYNVREFLQQAVASVLRAADGLRLEVIVVDNNSVDGSVQSIRECFPEVRLVENSSNVGFGAANNQAIRKSSGEFLLILNPDTIVQEDTIGTLVEFMRRYPDAGAAGCKILNPDGSFARESRRAFPTPRVAFYRITGLSRLFPSSPRFGRYNLTYLPVDEVAEVDALSGSCMMIRRSALCTSLVTTDGESGSTGAGTPVRLFDEDFFMYGEDLDLCYRIQAAGWKIYYTPDTQIIHYKGESTRKGDLRYVRLFYGAMLLFAEKHFGGRSRSLQLGLRLAILFRAAVSVMRRTLRRLAFPALDFALVYASVFAVASAWPGTSGRALSTLFLLTVPLTYALAAVIQVRLAGGYEKTRQRIGPVIIGLAGAAAFMAALSFFLKSIAFSRLVIVVSLVPAAGLLTFWRLVANSRRSHIRRAAVVGNAEEAVRLDRTVSSHYSPPFVVAGWVEVDGGRVSSGGTQPPRLGSQNQLRDIVRVHQIDDVIFATNGLRNRTVLSLMQSLHDLPVEFKTLVPDGTHIIGKARVDNLAIPVVPSEITHGRPSNTPGQRFAQRCLALFGLVVWPFVELISRIVPGRPWTRLRDKLRKAPGVLFGKIALVGSTDGDSFVPPPEWNIGPGLFSVSETLPILDPGPADIERAWLFYTHNRSVSLDVTIVGRSLIRRTHEVPM